MEKNYEIKVRDGRPVKIYPDGTVVPMTRNEVYETENPYLIDKYEDFYEYAMEILASCREDY